MKGGYRYKSKRSLRTMSTKFIHNRVSKSPNRKTNKRRKSRRKRSKKTRKRSRTSHK